MKKHIQEFFKIGLVACGGGPLILAIVYGILGAVGTVETVRVQTLVLGVLTSLLLAFIAGGISVVYRIEELPLMWASLIHACVLYLDYILIYLLNGWLKCEWLPLLVFTGIFLAGYILIWIFIYLSIRRNIRKLNEKMRA